MYTKFSKCEFWLDRMTFLGNVLSADGISLDSDKVKVVLEWQKPKLAKDVKSFLGLACYYNCFVEGFAKLA